MLKVTKFGGSSLASAEQMAKVGEIIRSDPDRKFIIPSAPGKRYSDDTKVTDPFMKLSKAELAGGSTIVRRGKKNFRKIIVE